MYIIGISVSFIRIFVPIMKKSLGKVWWFHIYLLNLQPRYRLMRLFGVADDGRSLRVARHIKEARTQIS